MLSPWPPPLPPGWYADPGGADAQRWWDGSGWTEHVHRAADDPPPGGPVPVRGAIVGLLVLLAVRVLVEVAVRPLRDEFTPLWLMGLLFYAVVFGPMLVAALRGLGAVDAGWRWVRTQVQARDLAWGVVVWISTVASGAVTVPLIRMVGIPFRSNGDVVANYRTLDTGLFAVTMVAAIVGAPLVEELFFRGLVLRGLIDRIPPWAAVVGQAVAFGLYHLIPGFGSANAGLVVVLTGYGLVFGLWARHFRRLGPTMVGHAITNTVAFLILLVR